MKYFYIDTNQYRHLFSEKEGFSEEVYALICELLDNGHGKLLLPQQTFDEVERNRLGEWADKTRKLAESALKKIQDKAKQAEADFAEYDNSKPLIEEITKHSEQVRVQMEQRVGIFLDGESGPNQKLHSLFSKAEIIPETDELYEKASRRLAKHNPPYDEKIGDALIWESILHRLETEDKPELIFVARDAKAWGKTGPNQWLVVEFAKHTSGTVTFVKLLSEIPSLTKPEQEKMRIAEEREIIERALDDFANSSDYTSAGTHASKLLYFKDKLDASDFARIIDAARTNYSINHSWFTTGPLKSLLEDGDNEGYALPVIESIDQNEWQSFERKIQTGLKRQHDEADNVDHKPVIFEDLPF